MSKIWGFSHEKSPDEVISNLVRAIFSGLIKEARRSHLSKSPNQTWPNLSSPVG